MPSRLIKTKADHRKLRAVIEENAAIAQTLTPAAGALTAGTVGAAATTTTFAMPTAVGAARFAVKSGALPPGKALNAVTGVLNGAPTAAGAYSFAIQATDTFGNAVTQNYTMAVA